jgi:uncharacterized protein (DUF3820 family)
MVFLRITQTPYSSLEGKLLIELEDEQLSWLCGRDLSFEKGIMRRTRAPKRSVILMVENAGIIPTAD